MLLTVALRPARPAWVPDCVRLVIAQRAAQLSTVRHLYGYRPCERRRGDRPSLFPDVNVYSTAIEGM